jgi:Cof subfamily protein (haloacid dehalogenase superfamily)
MKAIALDMDGTVLNDRGELTERLAEVLTKIDQKGIKVIFATGRTQTEILKVTPQQLPLSGYAAASGMSVFIDDKLVQENVFDKDVVMDILSDARAQEIYYETFTAVNPAKTLKQDKDYSLRDFALSTPATLKPYEEIYMEETIHSTSQWVDTINYNNVIKVFFISKDLNKIDHWHDYLEKNKERLGYELYKTSRHNCEIMLAGKDKATGLEIILNHYDIDFQDVHAFGDSMNDLAMFNVCGKSTAMKDSPREILDAADDVTRFTNDEYGLADYLETHYLTS